MIKLIGFVGGMVGFFFVSRGAGCLGWIIIAVSVALFCA